LTVWTYQPTYIHDPAGAGTSTVKATKIKKKRINVAPATNSTNMPPVVAHVDASDKPHGVIFHGPGKGMSFDPILRPQIQKPTDIVVQVVKTTICGTDLHILGGNVFTCKAGRRMGHEGIGQVMEAGPEVKKFKPGDRVVVSCITNCGKCDPCKKQFYGHCEDGGWILGNTIDGMQSEYARVPHADTSCHLVPPHLHDTPTEDQLVLCSDILPTALETGLLSGKITEDIGTVAIVGGGPVGLSAVMCTAPYRPKRLFVIDQNSHRLQTAKDLNSMPGFAGTEIHAINNSDNSAVQQIMKMTNQNGVDLVVECIGLPVGWYICQDIVKAGGQIAMLGVHGKPATINLERMWYQNFTLCAGMVHGFTTQMLMDKVITGKIDASGLISHRMKLSEVEMAYKMFSNAAEYNALKILLVNDKIEPPTKTNRRSSWVTENLEEDESSDCDSLECEH